MRYALSAVALVLLTACGQPGDTTKTQDTLMTETQAAHPFTYPVTNKGDVVDTYFEEKVADPYRWLEDDRSSETGNWVKEQNKVTFAYLEQISYRDQIKQRLEALWNYEKVGAPFIEGEYTYFFKNNGLQNQSVLYRKKGEGEAEVFLDPNTFSTDATTSLADVSFSDDGKTLAYSISEGGSDWRKIIIIDTETKKPIEETLVDVKFSGVSWKGNEGFYYSSYDKPEGSELSAKTDQHKLYYHKLGTAQKDDPVVFGGVDAEKHRYVGGGVTDDGKYLIVSAANATSGNKVFLKDLTKADSAFVTLYADGNADFEFVDSLGDALYFVTNLNAPNKKLIKIDATAPEADKWTEVIPETANVLDVSKGAGFLFANYMVDAISQIKQYDYDGKLVRDVTLPGLGTVSGFGGKTKDTTLYYSFTNYNTAPSTFAFEPKSGETSTYYKAAVKFNSDDYESKQVFYTSKDGTKVPMMITHKKGIKLDGSNPTMLYGYGGFNVSLTPAFSVANLVWMEMGGVYAVPNLRGGGEYGKAWHNAGIQLKKQNVFDDFIAAGEYLIAEKYTSSNKLAIRGGSNGGLLVGAVMTQRPDLVKVAIPQVGVLDMLRYHTFTAGAGWAYDYGTSEQSKEMYHYIKGYSPVHNVKEGVAYPATLVTTGDHDDRVVPAHSFKFAAELQAKATGPNPQMIRIETNAGHGAGVPVSKQIELAADIFGFTLFNMGVKELPKQ
ncbi:MAG: prolyl oligopeptidase family serine peptidase [Gammaproteobacteria bacterium]|nr:prolyl oligopeptidase family serine peptidase [Gammaproteobacteria bacterium]MBU2058810.1 prolyl oligopeptidase family serine peptidase [Gammaproteobacteria bacterium]MBU2177127.1 prolyl oligopeptidase family serine peptidase [Gammaproteobacteria bacterium]MBU2247113.1 prolyl oligopeptidase family serine peptidase [Gammaproteobacteria bacterium]MBU2343605.1 prolyl oligopeptidase family serine peptidase [Gammaproteobacteria bacterium]